MPSFIGILRGIVGAAAVCLLATDALAADVQPTPLAFPLPLPAPELVPPFPKWTLLPRTAKSIPLGTVVLGGDARLKGAPRENAVALNDYDYVEEEYIVSGTAKPYTTRVLIRRPADPNKFSGTVQIEPLGDRSERAVNWEWTWPYLVAHGDVWAGVTVSQDDAANMLRKFDPARYADVAIPDGTMRGDMLAQAAWLLRSPDGPLAKLHFDDRAAIVAGLFQVDLSGWGATGCSVRDFIEAGNPARARTPEGRPVINGYLVGACPGPEPLHPPADAAVIQLASESAYRSPQTAAARQADIDLPRGRYRWYDVAGAGDWSYLDQPQFSIAFFQMGWTSKGPTCAAASDRLPGMRYFARAILADLDRWQRVGGHPPAGAVFDLDGDRRIKRDDNGDALGGVRAFWVDVPRSAIAAKTNDGCDGYVSEKQFPREQSEKLYKDQADYVNKLTDNLIKLVNGNYLLAADADAVIARAKSQ